MKRFVICMPLDTVSYQSYRVLHDFEAREGSIAATAFHTLYSEKNGYLLFQQVAVSEPAGSRDEADDSFGKDSVFKDGKWVARGDGE